MAQKAKRLAVRSAVVAALLSFAGVSPAYAADYTVDCSQAQVAPYVDEDPSSSYLGVWSIVLDGSQEQTISVDVVGCDYHRVIDLNGVVNPYVGSTTPASYTITVPIDGNAEAGGYNTWGIPENTAFYVKFTNPTPTDGGGGDDGGGDDGGGDDGGGDDGGANESGSGSGTATNSLANTGLDATSGLALGGMALALGLALTAIRRVHRRS